MELTMQPVRTLQPVVHKLEPVSLAALDFTLRRDRPEPRSQLRIRTSERCAPQIPRLSCKISEGNL
jgi:hypothetical protein